MTDYCDFSDLPRDQCGHCKRGGRPLPPDTMFQANPAEFGPWFEAQYPGRCAADRRHGIEPGDQIRADGQGGYVCRTCGQEDH